MMEAEQRGILAIWHDIVPEHRSDVLAWYDSEHHFERLAVPGFLSVRRYHAVQGNPELFIRYETMDVGVLSSEEYLTRLNNPTPWTLRSQPQIRNNSRTVCVRRSCVGSAEGSFAVTLRIEAHDDADHLGPLAWDATADAMMGKLGVVGIELWQADRKRSTIATREKQLRGGEDSYVGSVVVAHATEAASADQAQAGLQASLCRGARAECGVYRLAFAANSAS